MASHLKPPISEKDHMHGPHDAKISLVEYGDYQCPHCGHAYPIIKQIQKAMGDKMNFVFRNFPLENIHPFAVPAARATEAAAKQNMFWDMHDMIFDNQENLHGNSFNLFAEKLGMNLAEFKKDQEKKEVIEKVEKDFESGIKSGVNGTPTLFINGEKYNGSTEYGDLLDAVEQHLIQ